jgi:hypothetical protein
MNGWMDVEAVLRIAYSNQKLFNNEESLVNFSHRKYIRIDITTLGRGHGRVCFAEVKFSHKSFSNIFFPT